MCGIHGIINKSSTIKSGYEGFMKDGFHAGSLRGMDSSGIMQIDKSGKPFMFKLAVPGPMFVESKYSMPFFRDSTTSPLSVGHVRAATVGRPTVDNAHPFCVSRADGTRLLGVHNGTLQGWSYKEDGHRYDVDSEWALSRIAKEGADAFEMFQGAWALVWWDEKTKDKVWVARNAERTLFFVRTKDKSGVLFASEAGMLSWLAERNRIEVEDTIYSFEPGKLYCMDMSGAEITWSKSSYPAYKAPSYTQHGNTGRWNASTARWEDNRGVSTSGSCNVTGIYGEENESALGVDPGCSLDVMGPSNKTEGKGPEKLSDSAKEVIDSMKKALSANRDTRFQRAKEEQAAGSEGTSASKETKEDYQADDFKCKSDWYSVISAGLAEQQNARDAGIMGELQIFEGVHFEPETAELYGVIEDYVPGTGKIKYDGLMRACTGSQARKFTPPTGKPVWVAIIGKGTDKKYKGTYYVVTPLNEKGQQALNRTAA